MKFKLIGIGEVLWDLLPGGRKLGGAPANFAYHACALGAEGRIISRVGQDAEGREILADLNRMGLLTDCIETDANAPTGTVSVEIASDGQPRFTIHEKVAWDRLEGTERSRRAVAEAHAICFGTLAQRNEIARAAIHDLLACTAAESLRILDVNLRQHFYSSEVIERSLRAANILKVNDTELPLLSGMLGIVGDPRSQLSGLLARYDLRLVACTRGERGSLLLLDQQWSDQPGLPVKVVDTVGAGDAFTAALALGLLARWDLDTVNRRANQVAAYVASCAGATPPLSPELKSLFHVPAVLDPDCAARNLPEAS